MTAPSTTDDDLDALVRDACSFYTKEDIEYA